MNGAERLCRTLEELGAGTVFGLPGTQNVALFAALGRSSLRTVTATSELGASFMANGFARAGGQPGVLVTIPGPGFACALPGLAEAFLDSAPLLHIAGAPATGPGRAFQLQAIDQRSMAAPVTKAVLDIAAGDDLPAVIRRAHALSLAGEPGPVLVQISAEALGAPSKTGDPAIVPIAAARSATGGDEDLLSRLREARRPLIYAGQGAFAAAGALATLAERLQAPILTTTSGRGVVPEDHPLVLPSDLASTDIVNRLVGECDLVLAVGVKFSHNGARGFRLDLSPEKLVHIDAQRENIGANFPAALSLVGDAAPTVAALVSGLGASSSTWTPGEVDAWRERLASGDSGEDPRFTSLRPPAPSDFFSALSNALPAGAVLTLDSGQHQMLARRYVRVKGPRGLLVPANFQSMGFGIPAALGAKIGRPDSVVVAVVGDGGFAMSAMELLTAAREGLDLTVIVFNDGYFGLIREQQASAHGTSHGTRLRNPDFARFAASVGAKYVRLKGDVVPAVEGILAPGQGVVLAEVVVRDSARRRVSLLKDVLAARARRLIRFGR